MEILCPPAITRLSAFLLLAPALEASPVINELMFHPPGAVENVSEEWLELYNDNQAAGLDLSGWKLTRGVAFTIPNGTVLAPSSYLIIAADVATFNATHPAFPGIVIGGWAEKLSNSGETLRLENAAGLKIDEVRYADEGDWAVRTRGSASFGHLGWEWFAEADGAGKSLELRNPSLAPFNTGQNWGPSAAAGGTPGAANSLASSKVAPLILDAKHRPQVPRSTDPIVISANFTDDQGVLAATVLHWRLDGVAWQSAPMVDTDGDGDREATLPPQPNLAVLEYYSKRATALIRGPGPRRRKVSGR